MKIETSHSVVAIPIQAKLVAEVEAASHTKNVSVNYVVHTFDPRNIPATIVSNDGLNEVKIIY